LIRPKTRREDLFEKGEELRMLAENANFRYINNGIRRIGKSSILNVFLNDIDTVSMHS